MGHYREVQRNGGGREERREESGKRTIKRMEEMMRYRIENKKWRNSSDPNTKHCQPYLTYYLRGTLTNCNIREHKKKNLNHRFMRHQRQNIRVLTKVKKQHNSLESKGAIYRLLNFHLV